MNEQTIDSLTRRVAAGVSRRESILALGGASLAALAGVAPAAAGKNRKKRKKDKRKSDKKCKQQEDQCNGVFEPLCHAEEEGREECLLRTGECCALLTDCQADEFLTCFLAILGIPEASV